MGAPCRQTSGRARVGLANATKAKRDAVTTQSPQPPLLRGDQGGMSTRLAARASDKSPIARRVTLLLLLVSFILTSAALAQRIEISTPGSSTVPQLEVRHLTLPDGTETRLVVIEASPITITIEDAVITANYLEFDEHSGIIRIQGPFTYRSESETIQGEDFIIDLNSEEFQGYDVLITTEAIDVQGIKATRLPGQISVTGAAFSPCSRCGQQVNDYGFKAKRLQLYPGDRLIAFEVTMLVRGVPVLLLPVMIVPLGPRDRQPRLSISQGTATKRAEIAIDWPYTAGASAFGVTSLRYYADVTPGEGNFFTENLLGGSVDESYLGGGVSHTFFTETGEGEFDFFYVPSFIEEGEENGKTRDEFTVRFSYLTLEEAGPPGLDLLIERDDARQQRITEYHLAATNELDVFGVRFFSQGYIDHDPTDSVMFPSYAGRTTPLYTLAQLTLTPEEELRFSVGPFILSGLLLDVGVFDTASNPANRSAAASPTVSAARLLAAHQLTLEPITPWAGFTISGITDFQGQYYSTGERLIDWNSNLRLNQDFGGVGRFSVDVRRNITEGETPFRFDTLTLSHRTDVTTSLVLSPLPWLSLSIDETYVLVDSRNPFNIGPGPLNTTLTLFSNLSWLSATFKNSYDLKKNDPGELAATVVLSTPRDLTNSALDASLTVEHTQDLKADYSRVSGLLTDNSATDIRVSYGYRPYLMFDMSGGYVYEPSETNDRGELEHYKPFEIGLEVGTLEQVDTIPGLRVSYVRNLNVHEMQELGLEFNARLGPIEASFNQYLNFISERVSPNSSYRLTWREFATFEASGFALLPPRWFGLEIDPELSETWHFSLRDYSERSGEENWELEYQTTHDPIFTNLAGGEGGFRNSQLSGRVLLESINIGEVRFGVDLYANLFLRDDAQPLTYLREARLVLLSEFYGVVGVQGTLEYRGDFNRELEEVDRARLTINDFAVTVKLFDELYVSGVLNDVWDLTGNTPSQSAFNFQPTFYVVWDRCCWALYSSLDTATGEFSITLTTPGGDSGFQQVFGTPLQLPGRGTPEDNDSTATSVGPGP